MKKRQQRPLRSRRLGVLAACLTVLPLLHVFAQSLETREQELDTLRSQIVELSEALDRAKSREESLETKVEIAGAELALQQAKVAEADQEVALASGKVEHTQNEVERLEASLTVLRDDLAKRLVGLYRLGGHGFFRLFISMEAGDHLLPAIRQLRFLVQRDQRTIDRYVKVREDLSLQRNLLEEQLVAMQLWRHQEVERRDRLQTLERRHQALLDRAVSERRRLAARSNALQDKERKLVSLMNRLGSDVSSLEGAPLQEFRGVLDWPARGEVSQEFGPIKDRRYQTEVPHHGLDLKLERGTKVRTVYGGEVIYASELEGYGLMVVVNHPGKIFTLYGGLELLNVASGDMLSLGDVIGLSTDLLYFEIRVENQPQNPRQWLR